MGPPVHYDCDVCYCSPCVCKGDEERAYQTGYADGYAQAVKDHKEPERRKG